MKRAADFDPAEHEELTALLGGNAAPLPDADPLDADLAELGDTAPVELPAADPPAAANGTAALNGDAPHDPAPSPRPHALCGAKCRDGRPCRQKAMPNGRCKMHGGKSLGGIASPSFRHGRRSRYLAHLTGRLRDGFKAALADPELLACAEEIALLQARIVELVDQLGRAAAPPWDALAGALDVVKAAGDADRAGALAALERVIHGGANAAARQGELWGELQRTIALKGRLAQAEQALAQERGALVPMSMFLDFSKIVLQAARAIIADADVLSRFQARVVALLPRPDLNGEP